MIRIDNSTEPATRFSRSLDTVADICLLVSGVLMVVLIVTFGWLVFGRYVLNATPTWAEQSSLLIVVWITFLGAAVGVWRRTHLAVDFVRDTLPVPLRRIVSILALLTMVGFGVVMAWQGYELVNSTLRRRIPLLGISESWRAVPVVISGILIVVFAGYHALREALAPAGEGKR